jgi:neurobeachin-like protein 1/2
MELNSISGRSYSDTTQYPVMPWILINFSTPKLTLSEESNFRNLSLPMGALGS